jgi:hypothetical protein
VHRHQQRDVPRLHHLHQAGRVGVIRRAEVVALRPDEGAEVIHIRLRQADPVETLQVKHLQGTRWRVVHGHHDRAAEWQLARGIDGDALLPRVRHRERVAGRGVRPVAIPVRHRGHAVTADELEQDLEDKRPVVD